MSPLAMLLDGLCASQFSENDRLRPTILEDLPRRGSTEAAAVLVVEATEGVEL